MNLKRIILTLVVVLCLLPIICFAGSKKIFTNSIGMKFVLIPKGTFMMGSALSASDVARKFGGKAGYYEDEHPLHRVTISRPFYLQTTEVTQGRWKDIMGSNPSRFKNCGDDCPVEQVSWDDAQEFIRKLNQKERTDKYRLPTEAEWEYACRAGTTTPFYTGDRISTDQANYNGLDIFKGIQKYQPSDENRKKPSESDAKYSPFGENRGKTVEVGSFPPNPWGLYNMHGNVSEWCQNRYYYKELPSKILLAMRVLRGGSWKSYESRIRAAYREGNILTGRLDYYGFRIARDY